MRANMPIPIVPRVDLGAACSIGKSSILVSVRDEGVGLPAGFDPETSKRLGTRLVNALANQLGAEVTRPVSSPWHQFYVTYSVGHCRRQLISCSSCTLECPLLALSRHFICDPGCPVSGVKRTCLFCIANVCFDPKRTSAVRCGNDFNARFSLYQGTRLSR